MKILAAIIAVASIISAQTISNSLTVLAQRGASPQTLWNYGYQLFYQQGFPRKEMAENLAKAYSGAKGVTDEQKKVLEQAAAYWQRELANWELDVVRHRNLPGAYNPYAPAFIPGFYYPVPRLNMEKAPRGR